MFTGIIETIGTVLEVVPNGSGKTFWLSAPIAPELSVDQSLSHNGACLTVEEVQGNRYRVTAIEETMSKTNLDSWQPGDQINLERCLALHARLDGHLVQGHVDTTAECLWVEDLGGSWQFGFRFPASFAHLVIEKGSICLNGISLTIFDVGLDEFTVAIIPYTYAHTNISALQPSHRANVEFDVIGKYIQRMASLK